MGWVLLWGFFGLVSAMVAANKGRSGCGWFVLGILFGPFAFVAALVIAKDEHALAEQAVVDGTRRKCPYCAELIQPDAIVCRYCGRELGTDGSDIDALARFINQSKRKGIAGLKVGDMGTLDEDTPVMHSVEGGFAFDLHRGDTVRINQIAGDMRAIEVVAGNNKGWIGWVQVKP